MSGTRGMQSIGFVCHSSHGRHNCPSHRIPGSLRHGFYSQGHCTAFGRTLRPHSDKLLAGERHNSAAFDAKVTAAAGCGAITNLLQLALAQAPHSNESAGSWATYQTENPIGSAQALGAGSIGPPSAPPSCVLGFAGLRPARNMGSSIRINCQHCIFAGFGARPL